MKRVFAILLVAILSVSCAHKEPAETTTAARQRLEQRWKDRLGAAQKADFLSDFGNPEWCKTNSGGEETCRFYKKIATRWIGEAPDKKPLETYDEVIATFGTDGTLREFKANALR